MENGGCILSITMIFDHSLYIVKSEKEYTTPITNFLKQILVGFSIWENNSCVDDVTRKVASSHFGESDGSLYKQICKKKSRYSKQN